MAKKKAGKKKVATRKKAKRPTKKAAGKSKAKTPGKPGARSSARKAQQKPTAKPGDVLWTELQSNDPARAVKFYSALLGWKTKRMNVPGVEYTILSSNGTDFGGVIQSPQPEMPSNWITYFRVRNAERSAERARELGGQIIAPLFHVPTVGHMAVVQDPTGAYFAVFQPDM